MRSCGSAAELRTGCVGIIGHMHRTLGELPDQPGLHRSEQQLALLCKLSRTLNIIENPLDLRRGKIRVNDQSRLLTVCLLETLRLQCLAWRLRR